MGLRGIRMSLWHLLLLNTGFALVLTYHDRIQRETILAVTGAVIASVGLWGTWRQLSQRRMRYEFCADLERHYLWQIARGEEAETRLLLERAEFYARLRLKYRRAISCPLLPVAPDLELRRYAECAGVPYTTRQIETATSGRLPFARSVNPP